MHKQNKYLTKEETALYYVLQTWRQINGMYIVPANVKNKAESVLYKVENGYRPYNGH